MKVSDHILEMMLSGKAQYKQTEYDYNQGDRHLFLFGLTQSDYLDDDQLYVLTDYIQQRLIEKNIKSLGQTANFVHIHTGKSLSKLHADFQNALENELKDDDLLDTLGLSTKVGALSGYPQNRDLIIIELKVDEYENYKKTLIRKLPRLVDITLGFIKNHKDKFSVESRKILTTDCNELIDENLAVINLIPTNISENVVNCRTFTK